MLITDKKVSVFKRDAEAALAIFAVAFLSLIGCFVASQMPAQAYSQMTCSPTGNAPFVGCTVTVGDASGGSCPAYVECTQGMFSGSVTEGMTLSSALPLSYFEYSVTGLGDCTDFACGEVPPPPECGDNVCNGTETNATCPADCPSICGNSTVEGGEQCDDGNTANGDGCSSTCQNEQQQEETSSSPVSDLETNDAANWIVAAWAAFCIVLIWRYKRGL